MFSYRLLYKLYCSFTDVVIRVWIVFADLWEEPNNHQELWNLVEVPEQDWIPQHVQGVPRHHLERSRGADVHRDGVTTPRQVPLHPDHQDCHCPGQALQEGEHQAVPQQQNQVPIGVPQGQTTNQEAQDHLQGLQAQLVHVIRVSDRLFISFLFGDWESWWKLSAVLFFFSRIFLFINVLALFMELNSTLSGLCCSWFWKKKKPFFSFLDS